VAVALLSEAKIEEGLGRLEGWRVLDGTAIERQFELADFASALRLVNRVGELAEAANHHPDILLHGWNKVRLTLSTHSAGGLTDADLILAEAIDRLS
jgi:4a-hydroxytetrahydrobiopterin dehydratase